MIQLIYVSSERHPFTPGELTTLLAKARQNNESLGVSGMLLYHNGSFMQVLEGEEPVVSALFDRISQDARHGGVELLLKSRISSRSFADWSMGFFNADRRALVELPGFHDFFGGDFVVADFFSDASMARKLLMAFRRGQWHQQVETGEAAATT